MKFKKTLLAFCLIMCIFFCVSSVAAGDVNDTAIASEDVTDIENQNEIVSDSLTDELVNANLVEEKISSSSKEETLKEKDNGTFTALRNKINNAPDGSTIFLENDYAWHDTDQRSEYIDPIYIGNRVLTIEGNGHKIDGSGKTGIFDISSSTITLNNIQFCNGYASSAGAIELSFSSVVITNSKFINNYANYSGGAIYARVHNDVIKISNCIFDNNYGLLNNKGTISGGAGGAINFEDGESGSLAEVTNCEFLNNVASRGGAIYLGTSFKSTLDIKNSKFLNNKAYYSGGAIDSWCEPELNIYDSTFKGNEFTGIYGWWGDIIVHDGSYSDNYGEHVKFVVTPSTSLIAKSITTTYNVNKNLIITLKDSNGNVVSDATVSVNLNGAKTYPTDKNGQVKVGVGSLVPKTYTAKISFAGNDNYKASSATAKVTVKKATPKLTAKAKTFKKSVKTKKYTVTLKTNQNKVMKNTKVTLKVNGKTYSAKTNAKGQATFKITKLTKKGKFIATIKYAGSKYYNAKTVKPKITVK